MEKLTQFTDNLDEAFLFITSTLGMRFSFIANGALRPIVDSMGSVCDYHYDTWGT